MTLLLNTMGTAVVEILISLKGRKRQPVFSNSIRKRRSSILACSFVGDNLQNYSSKSKSYFIYTELHYPGAIKYIFGL